MLAFLVEEKFDDLGCTDDTELAWIELACLAQDLAQDVVVTLRGVLTWPRPSQTGQVSVSM